MDLKIGNGKDWTFVASRWSDTAGGEITCSCTEDGLGLQGYCLAFQNIKAYSDLEAEFTVCMTTLHADIGFILRAQDPTHYYLIHFPQSGQSYRGQHFWAALSKADGSGYLRFIKLAHVQRVASNPAGLRHKARVKVTGDRFQVWINGYPALDVHDSTFTSGRIGLAGFEEFHHGKVTVKATEVQANPWNEPVPQIKNWFNPFTDSETPQGNPRLARTPNGDLLCTFWSGEQKTRINLARSTDNGLTWAVRPVPENLIGDIHLLNDGRLVSFEISKQEARWSQSDDDGKTWATPTPIPTDHWTTPMNLKGRQLLDLKDGTLVRFGLASHASSSQPITKWGAEHLQAFSIRSTDGGRSWSDPINLDSASSDLGELEGNLDLTETVAFETNDGRIMCLIRPIYSPWMWETWSYDQAKSWTPCVRGPFAGYAPSAMIKTQSGMAMIPTRFPGLTIHITQDDGVTWDEGTYIDSSIWAHGALCEIEPDLVLFIYEDSWRNLLRAQFIRVTASGLVPASLQTPTH